MFVTGIEITDNILYLVVVDLQLVLGHCRVNVRLLRLEVLATGTFLPENPVKLLDKETMRGHQDAGTLQFKCCGLGDQLGQERSAGGVLC